jgi:Secretion system C-terminal sorting domain/Metallo-peptidase family M12
MFYCIGVQAQQNVSELVEKAFANSRKDTSIKQEIVSDLIFIDEKTNVVNVNQDVKQSKYLDFNKARANELIAKNSETLSIQVIDDFGKPLVLDLINTGAFFENLKITTGSNKTFDFKEIKSAYYAGVVRGSEKGSLVSVSIFENEFVGIISIAEVGNLVIGKMKNSDLHIVYNDKAIANKFDFKFDTDSIPKDSKLLNNEKTNLSRSNLTSNKCIKIYLVTEFDVFQDKGSIVNVATYITALQNQVAILFLNEGVNTTLSEIKIWDVDDPFNGDINNTITQFRNLHTIYNGDVAQLITFRPNLGSYGNFNALGDDLSICSYNKNGRISVAQIYNVFNNVPTYSYSVYIATHQLGHTFGSFDTSNCAWNGNNTAIDDCGFQNTPDCPNAGGVPTPVPLPAIGGTIMSKCYLISSGINFSNGFGLQPGDRIRGFVSRSLCIDSCTNCITNLTINTPITSTSYLQVSNNISASSTINDNLNVNFNAKDILLQPNFVVKSNSIGTFSAIIDPCSGTLASRSSVSIFQNVNSVINSKNNELNILGLEIYPNPIKNDKMLYIKSDLNLEKEIIIYDFVGKEIINTITSANAIDVTNLNAGIYIVKVSENGKTNTLKVVIQ